MPWTQTPTTGSTDGRARRATASSTVTTDGDAAAQPTLRGPLDRSEVDDDSDYLNLGAIWLRGQQGMELRLEVNEQEQQITGVTAVIGESAVQLQAFAAPRTEGVWVDIRNEIAASIVDAGGTAEVAHGRVRRGAADADAAGRTRRPHRLHAGPLRRRRRAPLVPPRRRQRAGPPSSPQPPTRSTRSSAPRSSTAATRPCRRASCCRCACPTCRPSGRPGRRRRRAAGAPGGRRPQPVRARTRDHRGPLMTGP